MRWTWPTAALVGLALAPAVRADAPRAFELPVACDVASECFIQKHVDLDPGPERMDYACGRLSKDADNGTDFRVRDYPAMQRGVRVVAAAPGMVKAARDGMADVSVREVGADAIKGREAGNGVVIDHGDGWETQYSHLKQGSIAVKPGERVETGQTLGLIGLSGNTEFPHVEFSVRYQGRSLDPFVGTAPTFACGDARQPLWSPAALAQLPYRPSGLLISGFATERPDAEAARRGTYATDRLPAGAPALVFWSDIWGAMAGDVQRIGITGPGGVVVHQAESVLQNNNISWFAFGGGRRPAQGWPAGSYTGTYELLRDGTPVVTASESVLIE